MNKIFKKPLTKITIGLLFAYIVFNFYQYQQYLNPIPKELQISHIKKSGSNFNPIFIFLPPPFRYEPCGGAVYGLSDENIKLIKEKGLAFFNEARYARGYPPGSKKHYKFKYPAWQETPVPSVWISDGAWVGFNCIDWGFSKNMGREILKAVEKPGSYFTRKDKSNTRIIVIPSLRIVVYTYFH